MDADQSAASEMIPRPIGCVCQDEEGDTHCPVHVDVSADSAPSGADCVKAYDAGRAPRKPDVRTRALAAMHDAMFAGPGAWRGDGGDTLRREIAGDVLAGVEAAGLMVVDADAVLAFTHAETMARMRGPMRVDGRCEHGEACVATHHDCGGYAEPSRHGIDREGAGG